MTDEMSKYGKEITRAALNFLTNTISATNTANGWRDIEHSKGERIALLHSEASELLEWVRHPDLWLADFGLLDRWAGSIEVR